MSEDIDRKISEEEKERQHIADCAGVIDYNHFLEFKDNAIEGMLRFGNSFILGLAEALQHADDVNSVKIMTIWQSEVSECEMLYKIYSALNKQNTDSV